MFASLRRRLPRLGPLPRLCAVGCCLLLALESATSRAPAGVRAAPASSTPVVVAARGLAAGQLLRRTDLRVARWPPGLRPVTARADPAQLIGRRLTGPVAAREPVTGDRILGRDLAAGLPAGVAAAAVPVADAHVLDLVRPGDRVDLLSVRRPPDDLDGSARGPVRTLARAAVTVAVFGDEGAGGAEIVLALPRSAAVAVTRDAGTHAFTVVLAPP